MFVLHGGGERKGKKHEINVLKLTRERFFNFLQREKEEVVILNPLLKI